MSVLFWLKQNSMAECKTPEHEPSPPGRDRFNSYCASMLDKHLGKGLRSSPYGRLSFGRPPPTPMQQKCRFFEDECVDSTGGQAASAGSTSATCAGVDGSRELPVRSVVSRIVNPRTAIKGKQADLIFFGGMDPQDGLGGEVRQYASSNLEGDSLCSKQL